MNRFFFFLFREAQETLECQDFLVKQGMVESQDFQYV